MANCRDCIQLNSQQISNLVHIAFSTLTIQQSMISFTNFSQSVCKYFAFFTAVFTNVHYQTPTNVTRDLRPIIIHPLVIKTSNFAIFLARQNSPQHIKTTNTTFVCMTDMDWVQSSLTAVMQWPTCLPYVLDPYISTGCEEQPLHRDQ